MVSLPDGVRVRADSRRVQQVIRNLMENARKYGGDQVMVEGFVLGDQYLIVISDNGPGVPDEETQRVFDNFEQVSKGDTREATGIGLGLPIARRLARHGRRGVVRTAIPDRCPLLFLLPLRRRAVMGEEDVPEVVDLDATASVELGDDSVVAN